MRLFPFLLCMFASLMGHGTAFLPSSVGTLEALPGFQEPQRKKPIDTIIFTSGRKAVGTVRTISSTMVFYVPEGKSEEVSHKRRNVHMVVYANGRAERLNDLAFQEADLTDWRIIILTDDPDEVAGLYPLGVVSGESSKSNRTIRSARRSAETRLKKRAVAKGGIMVFVSKRQTTGGFREVPTYYIEGEAYGLEPPEGDSATVAN